MYARVSKVNSDIPIDSCPKIVEFENGSLSSSHEAANRIRFDLQRSKLKQSLKRKREILIADTGNMKYVGNSIDPPCRYYLGVFDKDSGDMEIYNTEVFKMQPKIIEENNKLVLTTDENNKETSFVEKNDRLVEAFGSARQKRAVSARKKNVIDKEEISNKILQVAENIDLSMQSPDSQDSPTLTITPPINLLASSPAQLYDIKDIISTVDEPVILEDASEFMTASKENIDQWGNESRFPEYVLEHLSYLPASEEAKLDKVVRLRYMSYLMQFFKLTYADLKKKDLLQNIPLQVRSSIFAQFSLEKGKKRFIPKRYKDKTLCYILVLALIIDEFTLDCSTLMRDLKLGPARIGLHLKAIGCHIESKRFKKDSIDTDSGQKSTPKTFATLKIPLPLNFLQRKETP